MQKLCCVCTRQQYSASLDYFVTSSPPYLHQFSTIFGGNCINREVLGRVLGPAQGEGNEMAQWVIKANGKVVPRRSLQPLTIAEKHNIVENKKRDVFDALIERRMGTSINPPTPEDRDPTTEDPTNEIDLEDDDEKNGPGESPNHEDILDSMGRILEQQPAFDKIINAEVMIQNWDEMAMGRVVSQKIS